MEPPRQPLPSSTTTPSPPSRRHTCRRAGRRRRHHAGRHRHPEPTPIPTWHRRRSPASAPTQGTTLGGTAVTITGTNFDGATSVIFGGAAALRRYRRQRHHHHRRHAGAPRRARRRRRRHAGRHRHRDECLYLRGGSDRHRRQPQYRPNRRGHAGDHHRHQFHRCDECHFRRQRRDRRHCRQRHHHHRRHAGALRRARRCLRHNAGWHRHRDERLHLSRSTYRPQRQSQLRPDCRRHIVTITGTGFTGLSFATIVVFGGAAATNVTVVNTTTITATTPAHAPGAVDVTVTNPGGTGTGTNAYTYVAPPTVLSVNPNDGSTDGGTSVTITGTNFTGATSVTFNGSAATAITVVNDSTITATTPAHAAGLRRCHRHDPRRDRYWNECVHVCRGTDRLRRQPPTQAPPLGARPSP